MRPDPGTLEESKDILMPDPLMLDLPDADQPIGDISMADLSGDLSVSDEPAVYGRPIN
jgi:hypothetical protein